MILKAGHTFNLLDARGAISVTERAGYIGRIRALSRLVASTYLAVARRARLSHACGRAAREPAGALRGAPDNERERRRGTFKPRGRALHRGAAAEGAAQTRRRIRGHAAPAPCDARASSATRARSRAMRRRAGSRWRSHGRVQGAPTSEVVEKLMPRKVAEDAAGKPTMPLRKRLEKAGRAHLADALSRCYATAPTDSMSTATRSCCARSPAAAISHRALQDALGAGARSAAHSQGDELCGRGRLLQRREVRASGAWPPGAARRGRASGVARSGSTPAR